MSPHNFRELKCFWTAWSVSDVFVYVPISLLFSFFIFYFLGFNRVIYCYKIRYACSLNTIMSASVSAQPAWDFSHPWSDPNIQVHQRSRPYNGGCQHPTIQACSLNLDWVETVNEITFVPALCNSCMQRSIAMTIKYLEVIVREKIIQYYWIK